MDLTLERMRQIRDVIWRRHRELEDAEIDRVERSTRAVMLAITASTGNQAGVEFSTHWRLYPEVADATANVPTVDQITSQLSGAFDMDNLTPWSEVERIAHDLREEEWSTTQPSSVP